MSNISVTGNQAQFNENVDFLKDVEIQGTLQVPNLETDGQLTIDANNVSIGGETTFLNRVNFSQNLSFTDLDLSNRLNVGLSGTIFTAFVPGISTFRGIVGIGTTQPKEFFEVAGKGKIVDLDLENLNVTGLSTFTGITTQQSTFFGKQLSVSGLSTFNDTIRISGSGNLILDGSGPQSLILQDGETAGMQISYRTTPDEFTIENQSDGSKFFLANRDNGQVELYNSDVTRLATTGVGITVFGDIVVPDVGIRTSRVGLGLTFDEIRPVTTTYFNDVGVGTLRLAVDGSISISKNIYDSSGSPGSNGFYLQRDLTGIRWTAFEPTETEGIFIQDEGTFIPVTGTAKSYSILNFTSINSFGQGTDNLTATDGGFDNPGGGNVGLSTIFSSDLWGFIGVGATASIYRLSNVGIGTALPSPSSQLDVLGDVEFRKQLRVTGLSTFNDVVDINANLDVSGNLDVDGQTDLDVLNVDETATFSSFVDINANLDVDGTSELDDLNVSGVSTFVGLSTFSSNIFVEATTDTNQLNVSGVSTFVDDIFIGIGATVGFGTTAYFRDNAKAVFGNNEDLVIYHSGDNSVIRDQGTGALVIQGQDVTIQDIDDNATMALFTQNGSVDLFHNNNLRFRTTGIGVSVLGITSTTHLNVTGVSTFVGLSSFREDVIFNGSNGTASVSFDKSDNALKFTDGSKAIFGTDGDLEIYHSGSHSFIDDTGTGNLKVRSNNLRISNGDESKIYATFTPSTVELYHDNSKKLETSAKGIKVGSGVTIETNGQATFAGVVTATKFIGDGSDLTGVDASALKSPVVVPPETIMPSFVVSNFFELS